MAAKLMCFLLLVAAPLASHATFQSSDELNNVNPMRKVVTLLQGMTSKISAEGVREKELFEKFMCYCKGGKSELAAGIEASKAKISELKSSVQSATGEKAQTDLDLKTHAADREAAKQAMGQATGVRNKEAAAFAASSGDLKANIAAMGKAIFSIESGATGSFLQTKTASKVRDLVMMNEDIANVDREDILAFLSAKQGDGYAPQSGQITGIMKQLSDEMTKNLADAEAAEKDAISTYEELMAAKTKQVKTLTAMIEKKSVRTGDLGVKIATESNDLEDTTEALAEDTQFLADMDRMCATKEAEWDERCKVRSEELLALADTIKILNDDDALELFKKTLPAASSFVQVKERESDVRTRALKFLKNDKKNPRMDLIELALRGKTKGFEFVVDMIENMVNVTLKEQADDDAKKEYCLQKFDETEDTKKTQETEISDLESAIADAQETLMQMTADIDALEDGIRANDKAVVEATEQRKAENADFQDLMTSDTACKDLIGVAKNRLNKFYNPKLYKSPPKVVASVLLQVRSHKDVAAKQLAAKQPETFGAYSKKSEESGGVIAMLDSMVADIDKEMQVAEVEEKDGQEEYERMMEDSKEKRVEDSKALTDKKSAKANTEAALQSAKDDKKSTAKALMETMKYIAGLHGECDWLLKYYDTRKTARDTEREDLEKSKATLLGADYESFVQMSSKSRRQAPEDELAKEMTHDLEMNFNKIAPFGKEDTAKELQDHAAKTQDTLVDAVENAEVAEIKRAVFRALTRLRAATIKEFDTIARLETQAIDAYNDAHHYRAENPLTHLHEDEAPVETDKLKSFH